jgi:hypothetical protein
VTDRPDRAPPPEPLHCAFCGALWDSGLFFGAAVADRDPPGKVPLLCCTLCHATRTNAELQAQFDAAVARPE